MVFCGTGNRSKQCPGWLGVIAKTQIMCYNKFTKCFIAWTCAASAASIKICQRMQQLIQKGGWLYGRMLLLVLF